MNKRIDHFGRDCVSFMKRGSLFLIGNAVPHIGTAGKLFIEMAEKESNYIGMIQSKEFANFEAEKNSQKKNINVENIVVPGVKKETKKKISLMFTPSQKEKVRRLSKSRGMSISEFLGKIIDQMEEFYSVTC